MATHILVDSELRWKTYCNPTLPPTSMHSLAQPSDDGRLPIDEMTNPESYSLLCSQLRAATEKRASQLSKTVMNDLERRLLQRQQSGWFETFLVAVILLNCVERTCWLFRSWEDETFVQRVSFPHSLFIFWWGILTSLVATGQTSSILRQSGRSLLGYSAHVAEDAQLTAQGHTTTGHGYLEGGRG